VRPTVERARFATRRDLDLEEALVPGVVTHRQEIRGRRNDKTTRVPPEERFERAPPVQPADMAVVEVGGKITRGEDLVDRTLPAELLDEPGEIMEEGTRAAPSMDMTLTRSGPPGFVTRRSSASARSASPST
jgi:hypothetical protein